MNRIREVLIEKGISQTELAKRLGKGFTSNTCFIQDSRDTECGCANTSYTKQDKGLI